MENLDLGINLGFGETSSVDNLIEKVNILEKSITNINEVSNMDMFTNALKSFQNLKSELKDIKSLLNEENQGKDKGNSAQGGKNPYKSETFSLSQTLLNIEKLLTEINSTSKKQGFNNGNYSKNNNGKSSNSNSNSNDNPLRKNANDELRKYYNNQEKTYKDKKLELDKISKMTTEQYKNGFSKIVKGISKDVVDILDRDLLKKMVEKSATEMLKNSKYGTKESLDKKYEEISQLIKNAGFNSNMFKNSTMFRKGYNEKLYEIENSRKIRDLKRVEMELKMKGINRNSNTDTMTGKQLEKLIEDNKRIYTIINSKHFQNFDSGKSFKSTEDKLNKYINQMNDNKIKGQNIKENGLSLQNTIQQNSSTMIAGIEAFRYLGTISNFITSKDFEKNIGALGIVGNLGNQASQNYSKNRIIRESNSVGADINEFAEGVREVIKTGKTYEQSMNLVKTAGKIAVASFEDLTTATNILNQRFTALNISATDKNLNEFANRLQSALDNTALDLQDVNYAGRQTNTAMNALINSAEEKGIQGRSVEQYTMDVSNLELSLLSTLKQQGKTGEQSGIVLRNLFSKLMSVDGKGKAMLENDFKKMTKEEREKVGFGSVGEMTDMVLSGEVDKVIEGLSKMQKQGNLSYATIKKIFTERHASAISTLFTEVNGDTKKFIDNITTGIDVTKNFGKAIENWAVKVERIFKNLKSISTNTFSRGIFGGVLGTGVGIADKLTDLVVKGQSSDNGLISSFSQGLPQAMTQQFMFKNINDFTQGKAYQKVENAYDLSISRIKSDNSLGKRKKEVMLNYAELMKNQDLENLINNKGINGFASQVKGATANVYDLSNKIKENVSDIGKLKREGIESFSALSGGAKNFGSTLIAAMKPVLILTVINVAVNMLISMYERVEKLKNEIRNVNSEVLDISKIGTQIDTIEKNIKNIFNPEQYKDDNNNGYISNIRKMVEANEQLKASIDNINAIKNNPFKSIEEIRADLFEKNKLSEKTVNNIKNIDRYTLEDGRYNRLVKNKVEKEEELIGYREVASENYSYKFLGDKFKNLKTFNKEYHDKLPNYIKQAEYRKEVHDSWINADIDTKVEYSKTIKGIDKAFDNAEKKLKETFGSSVKTMKKEDKEKFIYSNIVLDNKTVENFLGSKVSKDLLKGKDVTDSNTFSAMLQGVPGNTTEEKIQNLYNIMSSKSTEVKDLDTMKGYINYHTNILKDSDEIFYKQLERNKESLEQSKSMLESYKSRINSMYENTGLPTIAHGKILNEEKNTKGGLISLTQQKLDKYNTDYNSDINSIPTSMFMNNIEGVKEYQANMFVYYQKKAGLDKEIQDTQKQLEEAKKQGNLKEQQQLEAKLNWLNQDVKFLDQSKEMAKKVLHFSNFNAKTYQELLTMGTELAKNYAQYQGLVGSSFGNKGSQLGIQLSTLNTSKGLYNKIGKINFNNQVNSAYIQDVDGAKLKAITGKSDYSKVTLNDYNKVQSEIASYRKKNITTRNGVSIEDLQEQATMISSLVAEQYNMKQQELGFMQQEKQLQIDITKYYLERNKLIANFTESAETKQSDIDIKSANINYTMKYGNGKYGSIEELQRVTNLKLENSNLKMKDQLDYAKRQIMVAKENSTRQINAIRRLENKNTNNSQKSDTQAKQNSNETNRTIVDSANNISNNLYNALNQIMATIQTMQTSYSSFDGTYGTTIGSMSNISGFDYKSLSPLKGNGYNNVLPLATEISQKLNGQVSPGDLMKVFGLESDWKQGAVTGKYRGLGQLSNEEWNTWINYVNGKRFNLQNGSPNDPRANALMTALMLIHNADKLRQRGHTNVTLEDLHLSHLFTSYIYGNYTDSNKVTDIKGVTKEMIMKNPSITNKNMNITIGEAKNNIRNIYANKLKGKTPQVMQSIGSSGLVFDKNPVGVDPNLVKLLQDTHSIAKKQGIDFKVPSSGVWRDSAEQNKYFKQGGSKADGYKKLSRHQKGQALDIHILKGGEKAYGEVNKIVQQLASQRGMKIEWGGSWKSFRDPYHFQVNNSQWDSHKNPNLRTQGGLSGGTLQVQNITLPKAYIPKLDKVTQEDIEKITNYEIYKDQIKTEKDEQMLNELANLLKSLEGETYNVSIAKLTEKKNAIKSIQTPDETYDVSLNVIEQAISNFENKLETGLENLSKLQQNFIETLTELQFSFRELKNIVNSTNNEYTNAFNFLEQVSFTERFNEFMFKIEETQVKLEQYNKKLALETNYNNSVRQNLFGLLDKHNINIENNPLETGEDMKKFLSNREQMLDVMSIVEDMIGESISKNFDTLEFDKSSLKNISNEEIDKMKYEMATKLAEKESEGQKLIFGSSAELTNLFETLKLLKSQIEKTNEVRKTEIDLIKQNTKYLSEYSKNISNMLKEVNLTDNSKARNIRTLLAENSLVNKGISLESNYAKNYIGNVNIRNKYEEYQEEMYNFNRSLKYDSSLRSILKSSGYSDDYLNNYNLNNMNYNDINNMANAILDYQDKARYLVQQELNDLVNKFSLNDKFKDIDLTDMNVVRGLNAETLANETGNSVENMQEFLKGVNTVKNSVHNTDNILETLTKVLNANKIAHEESTKMYQELYKQGLNLLSDMLFGEGDFKGLSKEQYTQALDSLLQFSINSFGNASNSFKGLFNKDKNTLNDTTKDKTNVAIENNKQKNVLNTNNLLETVNESNVKLIDKAKHQDLIVSADKGLLIIPDELKRSINKNLEEKPLFNFKSLNSIDFDNKIEDTINKEPQLFSKVSQSFLSAYVKDSKDFNRFNDIKNYNISDKNDIVPLEIFNNKELRDKILNNGSDINNQLSLKNNKQKKKSIYNDRTNLILNSIVVLDGFMKKQMQYKKQELELQSKILEMNLQMAETTEERRKIEEQILQNKLAQVDNEYNTNSSFMGGAISGSAGFVLQGALSGAMTGMSLGGGVGAIVGAGLGLVGGLFGGSNAKIQAEQQKAQLIAQQKLQWLAEDRNKYLKTMASAMSEQAKWTTKIGVNDAISRSVKAVISSVDTIGGTASDTKTIQHKKKKGGGLLGSKKYDTVQTFTASYNTNDQMFGGRVFDDRTDLDFAYGVLTKKILGDKIYNNNENQSLIQSSLLSNSLTQLNRKNRFNNNYSQYSDSKYKFKDRRKNNVSNINNNSVNNVVVDNYTGSLAEYLDKKIATSGLELTSGQFLNAFWGRDTLKNMGMLQDTSRDWEISALVNSMKAQYSKMGASQEKVDMLALINFYENIQALLDKEGKTTKRLFGNYYGYKCNTSVTYSHYVIKVA